MDYADAAAAKEALRLREGKPHWHHIGLWESGHSDPGSLPGLSDWAAARGIEAVVGTKLPTKFQGEDGRVPTADEVVAYLRALPDEVTHLTCWPPFKKRSRT